MAGRWSAPETPWSARHPRILATRETVEIELPAAEGPSGLVLGARQILVSTFVLYQTMAWMGRSAGDWLAAGDGGTPRRRRIRETTQCAATAGAEAGDEAAVGGTAVWVLAFDWCEW